MNYIFVDLKNGVERIGLVEEDQLKEIYIDEKEKLKIGQIYRGRIQSVVKGLNSAFVDLGYEKNAYLSFKDIHLEEGQVISEVVAENREIIIQVEKEGIMDKGPKVTNKIELSGSYMVLSPYSKNLRISRKIKDRDRRKDLEELVSSINTEGYGLILRTSAEDQADESLKEEYNYLVDKFKEILREKNFLPCPKLIYEEVKDWEKMMLDEYINLDKIVVNDRGVYDRLELFLIEKIRETDKLALEDYSLEYDENAHSYIDKALRRKLSLNSGASIVFDELEALTAIDVNTQSVKKDKSFRKNILKTNLDSAKKIAQEIRLRNISGIILIDFINMDRKEDREKVRDLFISEMNKDRIKTFVYDYTRLGLLEISRPKKRNSLKNTWKP